MPTLVVLLLRHIARGGSLRDWRGRSMPGSGPGPIGLGSAPLISGIEAAGAGWTAKLLSQSPTANIAPGGAVRARLHSLASVSLRPVELSSGSDRVDLSVHGSSLEGGRLVQRLGAADSTYEVTRGGLEQRFSVPRQLSAASKLTLRLSSPVEWLTVRAGSMIVPAGVDAGRLAYAGLRTTDARGRVQQCQRRERSYHGDSAVTARSNLRGMGCVPWPGNRRCAWPLWSLSPGSRRSGRAPPRGRLCRRAYR
jgi:hypothetical protein